MSTTEQQEDEQMYKETTVIHRRGLTDAVLRVPLKHVNASVAICVSPETPLQEAVVTMREKQVGAVLICEKSSGRLVGIFTERDLLLRVAGRGWNFQEHPIGEVMTKDPECLTPKDLVGFALNKMMTRGYRHVPVINERGKPFGLVGLRDLLVFLCEHFPEDVINLPPTAQAPGEREGG